MLRHPYYHSAQQEQRDEAIERYKAEATAFLIAANKPVRGRVLEPVAVVETRH
jgi:hypothetical protein